MLDPSRMYPKSFHPMVIGRTRDFLGTAKGHTRTWCSPRYLLIDLGREIMGREKGGTRREGAAKGNGAAVEGGRARKARI
jgi:hypothetical protein